MTDMIYRKGRKSSHNLWYGERGKEDEHEQLAMFVKPSELDYVVGKLNRYNEIQSELIRLRATVIFLEQENRRYGHLMGSELQHPLCGSSYQGPGFTGEALRCNVPHEPGEEHGHLSRRLVTWCDDSTSKE